LHAGGCEKTIAGKKWLKRIVFGGVVVEMPVEIGPRITRIARKEEKKEKESADYAD